MTRLIKTPTIVEAEGTEGKIIKEFIGLVNSGTSEISIASMKSPRGWVEPGQTPEFDEYTLVLDGKLRVKTKEKVFIVDKNQCILVKKGEWVQYSSPYIGGAKYIAICLPAFSPNIVHRDIE